MPLLNILKYPDKRLREKSEKVNKVTSSIKQLIDDLFQTMYASSGIGLAAPQVGKLYRILVIDVPIPDPIDPDKFHSDPLALINPEIEKGEGSFLFEEGCLSCPELIVKVDRFEKIKVHYLNAEGKACQLEASGLKAVCLQHEMDHLNGILLVDKISRIEKDLYRKKRLKISKEERDLAKIL